MTPRQRLRAYYYMTKPGIVQSNALAAAGAFLLAAGGSVDVRLFVATVLGLALVMAGACVANNVMDASLDRLMARTQRRAIPRGKIAPRAALWYSGILTTAGLILLAFTTPLALGLAAFGWAAYVWLYGWGKRHTVHGTLIGSLSGSVPPVVGYTAVTGRLDLTALLLFVVLTCWQMPHFYAIGIFRRDDYAAAKLPILPVVRGVPTTKRHMLAWIIAFIIAVTLLTATGAAGITFLVIMLALSFVWLGLTLSGWRTADDSQWARRGFYWSLSIIIAFPLLLALESFLP